MKWERTGGTSRRGAPRAGIGARVAGIACAAALLSLFVAGCADRKSQNGVSEKDARDVQELLARKSANSGAGTPAPITLPPGTHFTREDLPAEGGYLRLPLVEITDAQADQLLRRLKTEFCSCGCPHTVDDCLIQDPACTTAQTLAHQILKEVITGS